jgi:hypothetical protein
VSSDGFLPLDTRPSTLILFRIPPFVFLLRPLTSYWTKVQYTAFQLFDRKWAHRSGERLPVHVEDKFFGPSLNKTSMLASELLLQIPDEKPSGVSSPSMNVRVS